jgi:hypothetical protein
VLDSRTCSWYASELEGLAGAPPRSSANPPPPPPSLPEAEAEAAAVAGSGGPPPYTTPLLGRSGCRPLGTATHYQSHLNVDGGGLGAGAELVVELHAGGQAMRRILSWLRNRDVTMCAAEWMGAYLKGRSWLCTAIVCRDVATPCQQPRSRQHGIPVSAREPSSHALQRGRLIPDAQMSAPPRAELSSRR